MKPSKACRHSSYSLMQPGGSNKENTKEYWFEWCTKCGAYRVVTKELYTIKYIADKKWTKPSN